MYKYDFENKQHVINNEKKNGGGHVIGAIDYNN